MKTKAILIIAVVWLAIACNHKYRPIRSLEKADSTFANRFRLHEIIVMYKKAPTAEDVDRIKASFAARGINMDALKVTRCHDCKDAYVELWQADRIHTQMHAQGIAGGTVSNKGTQGVGDDGLAYYSLNFISNIPVDTTVKLNLNNQRPIEFSGEDKDTITVAVLDTGIDTTRVVSPVLQWKNDGEIVNKKDDDDNCYIDDASGWNFLENNEDIADDSQNLHGTLVSHYIINEFARSPRNFVQIMTLKTHDKRGEGDLFSSICALHYAMNKGANIVNTSWGFYYYTDGVHPYLDSLITHIMRKKGILFVTAAGNKIDQIDKFARKAYHDEHGVEVPDTMLRNLEFHNFYPACLSRDGGNVITVTTTDGTIVSSTQNYSETYVDVGVMRDEDPGNAMKFKTPLTGSTALLSGSSYATAIACGKFGAYFPKSMYVPDLNKDAVFDELEAITPDGRPTLIMLQSAMKKTLIRKGQMTYPK